MLMYHLSKREIRAGSQLTRGVYGERIRRDDFLKAAYASYLKEEIFEDIRQRYYPDAPSRFKAVFLFTDLTTAKAFGPIRTIISLIFIVFVWQKMPSPLWPKWSFCEQTDSPIPIFWNERMPTGSKNNSPNQ